MIGLHIIIVLIKVLFAVHLGHSSFGPLADVKRHCACSAQAVNACSLYQCASYDVII
jgi:hypothetical protein